MIAAEGSNEPARSRTRTLCLHTRLRPRSRNSRGILGPRKKDDHRLSEARRAARIAGTLPEKLKRQRAVRALETKRDEADKAYEQARREIDRQTDALLDEISHRMEQQTTEERLFSIQWQVT